jgi:hypothetical protein
MQFKIPKRSLPVGVYKYKPEVLNYLNYRSKEASREKEQSFQIISTSEVKIS